MEAILIRHMASGALPPPRRRDVLRYAAARGEDEALSSLLDECLAQARDVFTYRLCYRTFDVSVDGELLDLSFARVRSHSLKRHLEGCRRGIVLAATVGVGIDRLVMRYSRTSPARALLLNALGTERIEACLDTVCSQLSDEYLAEGCTLTSRFSPGYGDAPLSMQRDVCSALDCARSIGITLNESLLMSPSKSVTALIGIMKQKEQT